MVQKIRLWEVADENVVGEVPSHAIALEAHLEKWLGSNIGMLDDRRRLTTLIAWSDRSDDGGMRLLVHVDRMAEHLGMGREHGESVLPAKAHEENGGVRNWRGASKEEKQSAIGLEGVFRTTEEVAKFVEAVQVAARNRP